MYVPINLYLKEPKKTTPTVKFEPTQTVELHDPFEDGEEAERFAQNAILC